MATRKRQKLLPVASGGNRGAQQLWRSPILPDGLPSWRSAAWTARSGWWMLKPSRKHSPSAAHRINAGLAVVSLAFSPDSRVLAAGTAYTDSEITLWDVVAKVKLRNLAGHRGFDAASRSLFSPDGKTRFRQRRPNDQTFWNTATWKEEITLIDHEDEVWSVGFSSDGKTLVSSGKDGSVYLWPAEIGRLKRGPRSLQLGAPTRLQLDASPDGKSIVAINGNGIVKSWDVATCPEEVRPGTIGPATTSPFSGLPPAKFLWARATRQKSRCGIRPMTASRNSS